MPFETLIAMTNVKPRRERPAGLQTMSTSLYNRIAQAIRPPPGEQRLTRRQYRAIERAIRQMEAVPARAG